MEAPATAHPARVSPREDRGLRPHDGRPHGSHARRLARRHHHRSAPRDDAPHGRHRDERALRHRRGRRRARRGRLHRRAHGALLRPAVHPLSAPRQAAAAGQQALRNRGREARRDRAWLHREAQGLGRARRGRRPPRDAPQRARRRRLAHGRPDRARRGAGALSRGPRDHRAQPLVDLRPALAEPRRGGEAPRRARRRARRPRAHARRHPEAGLHRARREGVSSLEAPRVGPRTRGHRALRTPRSALRNRVVDVDDPVGRPPRSALVPRAREVLARALGRRPSRSGSPSSRTCPSAAVRACASATSSR